MQRRGFHRAGLSAMGTLLLAAWQQAHALSLADLSSADASGGVKAALARACRDCGPDWDDWRVYQRHRRWFG